MIDHGFPGCEDTMRPPIIVVDREGWLQVYSSPEEVSQNLEAIDVMAGEYLAYDSEGRLLQLMVQEHRRRVLLGLCTVSEFIIRVLEAEEEPSHREDLRRALQRFLEMTRDRRPLGDEVERLLGALSETSSQPPSL